MYRWVCAGLILALTGCGSVKAGLAATSDEFDISQSAVDTEIRTLLDQTGQPPGAPPSGLALATTQRLIQDALFEAKAKDLGIKLTGAQVENARAEFAGQYGGDDQLVQAAGQSGIPAGSLDAFVRSNLLFNEIAKTLTPGVAAPQQQAAAQVAMGRFSEEIDLAVSPRYGKWQPSSLQIAPGEAVVAPAG